MIIPELPAYLDSLGGEDYKGWIIALFTLMAGISRPFSGKLSDTVGCMPVMIFGTLVCVVCSGLYPLLPTVAGFLTLRFFHGFSTGFKPTASSAYLADIVPVARRGEAMGVLGVSMNAGASASPPLGSWIAGAWNLDAMFYTSSGLAFLSIIILIGMKETLTDKQPFSPKLLVVKRRDVIDPKAIPPAIVTFVLLLWRIAHDCSGSV
jgi:MFS family permease